MSDATFYWIIFGTVLALMEIIIPGLVVLFLGFGALTVAALMHFGLISGWMTILTTWFVVSLVYIILLRSLFQKIMPGDEEKGDIDEDKDAIGTVVPVVVRVTSDSKNGRVRFRGTTWLAVSKSFPVEAGQKVKLVERRDLVWYVEPLK